MTTTKFPHREALKIGLRSCWRQCRLILALLLLVLGLMSPPVLAQSLQDLPNPRQQNGSWIQDRADLISPAVESQLNHRFEQLTAKTSAELAIATLPQLQPSQEPHAFALEVFNTWKIGQRRRNNGVLLFVAQENRRVEVVTGKGLRETLPDAEVANLIRQEIVPAFQQGEYEAGLVRGASAIAQRLEERLPSTVLSPAASLTLLILGGLLGAIGYGWLAMFTLKPVPVTVPAAGLDQSSLRSSSTPLTDYSLTNLLADLFNSDAWKGQRPWNILLCLWGGGTLLGMGMAISFWRTTLVNPDWDSWPVILLSGLIYALACSLGVLLANGILFTQGLYDLRQRFVVPWLITGVVAGFGGLILAARVPSQQEVLSIIPVFSLMSICSWSFTVGNLKVQRPWRYVSDRSGQPVTELSEADLETVLTSAEKLAIAMHHLDVRGWRDPEISPPLTREQVYLVQRIAPQAYACANCQAYTVEKTTHQVEKTIQSRQRVKGQKKKQVITSVIPVTQTVYTCRSCGHVNIYEPTSGHHKNSDSNSSSDYSPTLSSDSSSNDYDYNRYDTYDNTPSSDFGGGSSDGSGAGSDW